MTHLPLNDKSITHQQPGQTFITDPSLENFHAKKPMNLSCKQSRTSSSASLHNNSNRHALNQQLKKSID